MDQALRKELEVRRIYEELIRVLRNGKVLANTIESMAKSLDWSRQKRLQDWEALRDAHEQIERLQGRVDELEHQEASGVGVGVWLPMDDCMSLCSVCHSLGCGTPYCAMCGSRMQTEDDPERGETEESTGLSPMAIETEEREG